MMDEWVWMVVVGVGGWRVVGFGGGGAGVGRVARLLFVVLNTEYRTYKAVLLSGSWGTFHLSGGRALAVSGKRS